MTGNGRYQDQTKPPNVAASVSDLTHDVIELSELQAQLLSLDFKQSTEKARTCLILAVFGACVLLGTIPVALIALGVILIEQLGWSYTAAAITAAVVGLATAGTVFAIAWTYIQRGLISFDRSRQELRRNIAWVKHALRTRGQAVQPPHSADRPLSF